MEPPDAVGTSTLPLDAPGALTAPLLALGDATTPGPDVPGTKAPVTRPDACNTADTANPAAPTIAVTPDAASVAFPVKPAGARRPALPVAEI